MTAVRIVWHSVLVVLLTVVTQIGGLAWLWALLFRRRMAAFVVAYLALWAAAFVAAPIGGRVALSCWQDGPLQVHSWAYCATNRTYMQPELLDALTDVADKLQKRYPGATVQVLDAGFPFWDGFPLLPHLSHDDGQKVDLAFFYRRDGKSGGVRTPSPLGYFAFEPGPTDCPKVWPTMRWDLEWLQPVWPVMQLNDARTAHLVELLVADPRVGKLFLEPHLVARFGLQDPKIRFQGCRAARHDDHIHLQLW